MTLEEIRSQLQDRRVRMVAAAIGVHHSTIYALRDDPHHMPTRRVAQAVADYLSKDVVA
jgi:hypothetical protein